MDALSDVRVIHSYDTELRRVRCGQAEQSNSTKHVREVTCLTCRGLLDRARAQQSAEAAAIDPAGP